MSLSQGFDTIHIVIPLVLRTTWQANQQLEEQLSQARAADTSPERCYSEAMKANAVITAAAENYDSIRQQEIGREAEHKMFYYQEVMECKQAFES